jgi:hypothetical protein
LNRFAYKLFCATTYKVAGVPNRHNQPLDPSPHLVVKAVGFGGKPAGLQSPFAGSSTYAPSSSNSYSTSPAISPTISPTISPMAISSAAMSPTAAVSNLVSPFGGTTTSAQSGLAQGGLPQQSPQNVSRLLLGRGDRVPASASRLRTAWQPPAHSPAHGAMGGKSLDHGYTVNFQ